MPVGLAMRAAGAAAFAGEDRLDLVGTAHGEVVTHDRVEHRAGVAGRVEHQGAGHLDLAHRQLPPVAAGTVIDRQRRGNHAQPTFEEHQNVDRSEAVTDLLQPVGVSAGGEAVGQRREPDAGLGRLAFGPLMPVDPHLRRYGKYEHSLMNPGPKSSSQT